MALLIPGNLPQLQPQPFEILEQQAPRRTNLGVDIRANGASRRRVLPPLDQFHELFQPVLAVAPCRHNVMRRREHGGHGGRGSDRARVAVHPLGAERVGSVVARAIVAGRPGRLRELLHAGRAEHLSFRGGVGGLLREVLRVGEGAGHGVGAWGLGSHFGYISIFSPAGFCWNSGGLDSGEAGFQGREVPER